MNMKTCVCFSAMSLLTAASAQTLAVFTFDDELTRDVSGNGVVATALGTPMAVLDGYEGGAMLVNGASGVRVNLDINPSVRPKLTMGGWVRSDAVNPIRHFLSHDNLGFDRNISIDWRAPATGWSAFTGVGVLGGLPAAAGEWQFIAAVYDDVAGTVLLYVDGEVRTANGRPGGGFGYTHIGQSTCCDIGLSGRIDGVFFLGETLSVARLDEIRAGGVTKVPTCPIVYKHPAPVIACPDSTSVLSATLAGSGTLTARWQRETSPGVWTNLVDGATGSGSVVSGATTSSLSIAHTGESDQGRYRCSVTNACGAATSQAASLSVCAIDINCDGFSDFFDYDDYVTAFERGEPRADFNGDGFTDFFDYGDFVAAFEEGC